MHPQTSVNTKGERTAHVARQDLKTHCVQSGIPHQSNSNSNRRRRRRRTKSKGLRDGVDPLLPKAVSEVGRVPLTS